MYKTTIGLEIHVQLCTKTKMFCSCSSEFFLENTSLCEICTAQPGTLPSINKEAVLYGSFLARALHSSLHSTSQFIRKNYRYPDLPKSYQITQYQKPLASGGYLTINDKTYTLDRIQLEEDSGKLFHEEEHSYLDLNRAGMPLLEIVTEPVFHTSQEVIEFLKTLHELVTTLGISKGKMQEGHFRCDVNISLSKTEELGTRTEIKNLNSFKAIEEAIFFEEKKHKNLLLQKIPIKKETLFFDGSKTISLRDKDSEEDYRFFIEPDLFFIENPFLEYSKEHLPELPLERIKKIQEKFSLKEPEARMLFDSDLYVFFEECLQVFPDSKKAFSYITNEVMGFLKETHLNFETTSLKGSEVGQILSLMKEEKLLSSQAKELLVYMLAHKKDLSTSLDFFQFTQEIISEEDLKKVCLEILHQFPKEVEDYQQGNDRKFTFFVGQVLKHFKGKLSPQKISSFLLQILKK